MGYGVPGGSVYGGLPAKLLALRTRLSLAGVLEKHGARGDKEEKDSHIYMYMIIYILDNLLILNRLYSCIQM